MASRQVRESFILPCEKVCYRTITTIPAGPRRSISGKLEIQPDGIEFHRPIGSSYYLFVDIEHITAYSIPSTSIDKMDHDEKMIILGIYGCPRFFTLHGDMDIFLCVSKIKVAASKLGLSLLSCPQTTVEEWIYIRQHLDLEIKSEPSLSLRSRLDRSNIQFQVRKKTTKSPNHPIPRILELTNSGLIEYDAGTRTKGEIVAVYAWSSMLSLIRYHSSSMKIMEIEFMNGQKRAYMCDAHRDELIAAIYDRCLLSNESHAITVTCDSNSHILRLNRHLLVLLDSSSTVPLSFFKEKDEEEEINNENYSICLFYLKRLAAIGKWTSSGQPTRAGIGSGRDLVSFAQVFNTNIPITGIPLNTKKSTVQDAIKPVVNQLLVVCQSSSPAPKMTITLLQTLDRISASYYGNRDLLSFPNPSLVSVLTQLLVNQTTDEMTMFTLLRLIQTLSRSCEVENQPAEQKNKLKLNSFVEAMIQLLPQQPSEVWMESTQAITTLDSAIAKSNQSNAIIKKKKKSRGALVVMMILNILEGYLCSRRSYSTSKEQFQSLLSQIIPYAPIFLQLLVHSQCPTTLESCTLILKTMFEDQSMPDTAAAALSSSIAIKQCFLQNGMVLYHLFHAIFNPEASQRQLSRYVCSLMLSGTFNATAFLYQLFPSGFVYYLEQGLKATSELHREELEQSESEFWCSDEGQRFQSFFDKHTHLHAVKRQRQEDEHRLFENQRESIERQSFASESSSTSSSSPTTPSVKLSKKSSKIPKATAKTTSDRYCHAQKRASLDSNASSHIIYDKKTGDASSSEIRRRSEMAMSRHDLFYHLIYSSTSSTPEKLEEIQTRSCRKCNFSTFFLMLYRNHSRPDIVWNATTREELFHPLEKVWNDWIDQRSRFRSSSMLKWNYHDFHVEYPSIAYLTQQVVGTTRNIHGKYYLELLMESLLLSDVEEKSPSSYNNQSGDPPHHAILVHHPKEIFHELYHLMLKSWGAAEHQGRLQPCIKYLKAMQLLYSGRYVREIGHFEELHYLCTLLNQTVRVSLFQHMLQLIEQMVCLSLSSSGAIRSTPDSISPFFEASLSCSTSSHYLEMKSETLMMDTYLDDQRSTSYILHHSHIQQLYPMIFELFSMPWIDYESKPDSDASSDVRKGWKMISSPSAINNSSSGEASGVWMSRKELQVLYSPEKQVQWFEDSGPSLMKERRQFRWNFDLKESNSNDGDGNDKLINFQRWSLSALSILKAIFFSYFPSSSTPASMCYFPLAYPIAIFHQRPVFLQQLVNGLLLHSSSHQGDIVAILYALLKFSIRFPLDYSPELFLSTGVHYFGWFCLDSSKDPFQHYIDWNQLLISWIHESEDNIALAKMKQRMDYELHKVLPHGIIHILAFGDLSSTEFCSTIWNANLSSCSIIWNPSMKNQLKTSLSDHCQPYFNLLHENLSCTFPKSYNSLAPIYFTECYEDIFCSGIYLDQLIKSTPLQKKKLSSIIQFDWVEKLLKQWKIEIQSLQNKLEKESTSDQKQDALEFLNLKESPADGSNPLNRKELRKRYTRVACLNSFPRDEDGDDDEKKLDQAYDLIYLTHFTSWSGIRDQLMASNEIFLRAQVVIFQHFSSICEDVSEFRYAEFDFLFQQLTSITIRQHQQQQEEHHPNSTTLVATILELILQLCLLTTKNAEQLLKETRHLHVLVDVFHSHLKCLWSNDNEEKWEIILYCIQLFSGFITLHSFQEILIEEKPVATTFLNDLNGLLGYFITASNSMSTGGMSHGSKILQYTLETISRISFIEQLSCSLFESGIIWPLVQYLFTLGKTNNRGRSLSAASDGDEGEDEETIQIPGIFFSAFSFCEHEQISITNDDHPSSVQLFLLFLQTLGCIAKMNPTCAQVFDHLFTPGLALMIVSPSYQTKEFYDTFHSEQIIDTKEIFWTKEMRAELMLFHQHYFQLWLSRMADIHDERNDTHHNSSPPCNVIIGMGYSCEILNFRYQALQYKVPIGGSSMYFHALFREIIEEQPSTSSSSFQLDRREYMLSEEFSQELVQFLVHSAAAISSSSNNAVSVKAKSENTDYCRPISGYAVSLSAFQAEEQTLQGMICVIFMMKNHFFYFAPSPDASSSISQLIRFCFEHIFIFPSNQKNNDPIPTTIARNGFSTQMGHLSFQTLVFYLESIGSEKNPEFWALLLHHLQLQSSVFQQCIVWIESQKGRKYGVQLSEQASNVMKWIEPFLSPSAPFVSSTQTRTATINHDEYWIGCIFQFWNLCFSIHPHNASQDLLPNKKNKNIFLRLVLDTFDGQHWILHLLGWFIQFQCDSFVTEEEYQWGEYIRSYAIELLSHISQAETTFGSKVIHDLLTKCFPFPLRDVMLKFPDQSVHCFEMEHETPEWIWSKEMQSFCRQVFQSMLQHSAVYSHLSNDGMSLFQYLQEQEYFPIAWHRMTPYFGECVGHIYLRLYLQQPFYPLQYPQEFFHQLLECWMGEISSSWKIVDNTMTTELQGQPHRSRAEEEQWIQLLTSCCCIYLRVNPSILTSSSRSSTSAVALAKEKEHQWIQSQCHRLLQLVLPTLLAIDSTGVFKDYQSSFEFCIFRLIHALCRFPVAIQGLIKPSPRTVFQFLILQSQKYNNQTDILFSCVESIFEIVAWSISTNSSSSNGYRQEKQETLNITDKIIKKKKNEPDLNASHPQDEMVSILLQYHFLDSVETMLTSTHPCFTSSQMNGQNDDKKMRKTPMPILIRALVIKILLLLEQTSVQSKLLKQTLKDRMKFKTSKHEKHLDVWIEEWSRRKQSEGDRNIFPEHGEAEANAILVAHHYQNQHQGTPAIAAGSSLKKEPETRNTILGTRRSSSDIGASRMWNNPKQSKQHEVDLNRKEQKSFDYKNLFK